MDTNHIGISRHPKSTLLLASFIGYKSFFAAGKVLIFYSKKTLKGFNTDLGGMSSQTAFSGEAFATDVAVEGSILCPLHLSVVVPQVLLEIGQLDEGSPAVW